MRMHVSDVRDRITEIERIKTDDEQAHSAQDNLLAEVLTAIASGDVSLRTSRAIAREALKVYDIEFARWMA